VGILGLLLWIGMLVGEVGLILGEGMGRPRWSRSVRFGSSKGLYIRAG